MPWGTGWGAPPLPKTENWEKSNGGPGYRLLLINVRKQSLDAINKKPIRVICMGSRWQYSETILDLHPLNVLEAAEK